MAIAFNLPSEREAPEENFSRLNRLLTELYEVLCHILVARQPPPNPPGRLDRPFSESDIDRPIAIQPRTRSANIPPPLLLEPFDLLEPSDLDDDVFISPRADSHDLFSTRNMEIFGSRYGIPRTPAGVLLSPRRERFTFFGGNEKHWRDKGGTGTASAEIDEPDAVSEASTKDSESSDSSIFSSIMTDKVSGSICTAVIFMLGWKLLSTKR